MNTILDIFAQVEEDNAAIVHMGSMYKGKDLDNVIYPHFKSWKRRTEFEQWAKVMDSRDWMYLLECRTWNEFHNGFMLMKEKYIRLWEIVGRPQTTDEWLKRSDYRVIGADYWETAEQEIDFTKQLVKA